MSTFATSAHLEIEERLKADIRALRAENVKLTEENHHAYHNVMPSQRDMISVMKAALIDAESALSLMKHRNDSRLVDSALSTVADALKAAEGVAE